MGFRRWTGPEDLLLRRLWHVAAPSTILARLPGRSWGAIQDHATRAMHLPAGMPPGYVSLGAASRRAGYAFHTLVQILGWARVATREHLGGGSGWRRRGRPWARRIVRWSAVDRAVRRWLRAETVADVARRLGVGWWQLDRWLRVEGWLAGKVPGAPARLDPEVSDQVVARHRARRQAA